MGRISRRRARADDAPSSTVGAKDVRVHYARGLDAEEWQRRHAAGEVPDRWPYGLHGLSTEGTTPVRPRDSVALRSVRKLAGGYDWYRLLSSGDAAVCWDERAGVPVALSGVPTLTGVIWLTEHNRREHWTDGLARRALSRSTVFVLSPLQLPVIHARWGVSPAQSHFVPFGVDDTFWQPLDGQSSGVLVVGNDRHRDHPTAIRAVAEAGASLTLVTKQDLPVAHVPFLSHRDLRQAYADHAVVALATGPNVHASGVTVLLEAMACARPVVATRGGGLEEYLTPEAGLLVPPGDASAMAAAIRQLLADPRRAAAMGQAGRVQVRERYNTRTMAATLGRLLATL